MPNRRRRAKWRFATAALIAVSLLLGTWAFERPSGGRSFTFTALHYLARLDDPELRKLLPNATFVTAVIEALEDPVGLEAAVRHTSENTPIAYSWGTLTWYVSRELGNSDSMTVGQAVIRPGHATPRHYHPNCDEVLHVLQGHILQIFDENEVEMSVGDTISIRAGIRHSTRNIGPHDAVLALSYSSADRQTVGE